jgi:two-component system, NtrC family, sensor kinase
MSDPGRILIVEDSETQALALRGVLEKEGFRVDVSPTAEAALEQLNGELPDLVVADFHLPGMDGRELSRQIRLNGRTRALPVLMLTSAREVDVERQGLESGVDAYLSKSSGVELLVARLRALLRRPQASGAERGRAFRRARVLLVHDSPTGRLRLSHLLQQEGYEVLEADTAEAAVRNLDEEIDCVILPLAGAAWDGLELARAVDAQRQRIGVGFQIVMLAPGQPGQLAAAFEAGADEVVRSEDSDDVLRVRLRALMRRKMLVDEARRAQAAEARAAAADELARTNADLQEANSRLREAQAQLVQSAKMASLGELVAGIAHEINNPLAFILGHQDTVERLVGAARGDPSSAEAAPALAKAQDRLGSMRMGLQRIQTLVLNLRKFSRLDEAEKQVLDVPDAVETVLALLKPKLADIEVRRRFEAAPALYGSPALLNQVVMNILSNAADALDGRGAIEIATREEDGCYLIEIIDSGPGVPVELRDRIFEPFFTTKPVGSGTGLGLAIAYSVVRAHDGAIEIDDGPLGGARFTLSLPIGGAP